MGTWKRRGASLFVVTGALVATVLPAWAGTASASPGPAPVTSGLNNWLCRPSAAHPEPVVLLHGLGATWYEDTGTYIAPYLAGHGYCVFALTYGATSILGPWVGGVGGIGASAQQIATYVDRVLAVTGAAQWT